ncbi:hypothetical protein [Parvibacter caecicola]|uniref:Uncharacterized protein n=1 Tax=Parvibacter caecicola TaxID=747645 RepID=A0A7W5D2W4_9ACTN|nr:hypothetical protein [Parvibacter caecicola]MBB3171938.1 hypothetical protein [Parvibacter caecicola]MCR2041124.1 hypothetical protein [Parvibacter caecicola]RNL11680.1 hypothetical protein DMP11_02750 [Parvibacter caecicola]
MAQLDIANVPQWYLQRAVDDMVPGLSIFVRDTTLESQQLAAYQVGQVLRVDEPLCATKRVLGPSGNVRFAIMSNHMEDLGAEAAQQFEAQPQDQAPSLRDLVSAGAELPGQEEEPGAMRWGLMQAAAGSHFKMIDVFPFEGVTQITLLHLPDDERWRLFTAEVPAVEHPLVDTARERFQDKIAAPVIVELQDAEYQQLTAGAIGCVVDGGAESGEELRSRAVRMHELPFRAIAGKLFLLQGAMDMVRASAPEGTELGAADYPDALAYGIIDEDEGLCLFVLSSARLAEGGYQLANDLEGTALMLPYTALEVTLGTEVVDGSVGQFGETITRLEQMASPADPYLYELRKLDFFDGLRHPQHPDWVRALVASNTVERPASAWLRIDGMGGQDVAATLLTEVPADLGVAKGQQVPLQFHETEDGLLAVAVVG